MVRTKSTSSKQLALLRRLAGCFGWLVLFGLLCVALAVGGYFAYRKATAPTAFQEFSSRECNFKVLMPGTPDEKTETAQGGITAKGFLWEPKKKHGAYVVLCADVPIPLGEDAFQINQRLDGVRQGMMGAMPGSQLISEVPITLHNRFPGREIVCSITQPKPGRLINRVYLVGRRMYQVMIGGSESWVYAPDATTFANSFALLEMPGNVGFAPPRPVTNEPAPIFPAPINPPPRQPTSKEPPFEPIVKKEIPVKKEPVGKPYPAGSLAGPLTAREDVSFASIGLNAADLSPSLTWSADAKSFYCLERKTGLLKRINFADFSEQKNVNLNRPCLWLSTSAAGLLVSSETPPEMLLLDPDTFDIKARTALLPGYRVVSSPTLLTAYAAPHKGGGFNASLGVINLTTGLVVGQYPAKQFGKLVGLEHPQVSPNGMYLFTKGGIEEMFRFRIAGPSVVLEDKTVRIAQGKTGEVQFSPDSSLVCMPGNNYGARGTYVYAISNLKQHAFILSDLPPDGVGFDPARKQIYGGSLSLFEYAGAQRKHYNFGGIANQSRQILVHPAGGKFLLLYASQLAYVEVP